MNLLIRSDTLFEANLRITTNFKTATIGHSVTPPGFIESLFRVKYARVLPDSLSIAIIIPYLGRWVKPPVAIDMEMLLIKPAK